MEAQGFSLLPHGYFTQDEIFAISDQQTTVDLGESDRQESLGETREPADGFSRSRMPLLPTLPSALPPYPDLSLVQSGSKQMAPVRRSFTAVHRQDSTPYLQTIKLSESGVPTNSEIEELMSSFIKELESAPLKSLEVVKPPVEFSHREARKSAPLTSLQVSTPVRSVAPEIKIVPKINSANRKEIEKLKAKALKKDSEALFLVGQLYKEGSFVKKSLERYFFFTSASADLKFTPAQAELSRIYRTGLPGIIGAQLSQALLYAEFAADACDAECSDYLGQYYFDKKEYQKALKYSILAGTQEILSSILRLKRMYAEGLGCSKNEIFVLLYRQLAAKQQDPESLYEMHLYHKERKEWDLAVGFAEKAASYGHSEANDYMGHHYYGRLRRPDIAVTYLLKACNKDNPSSHETLGLCYEKGEGVQKDSVQSAKHYQFAADHGRAFAMLKIGICFRDGIGVARSLIQAERYLRMAVEAKQPSAYEALMSLGVKA